MTTRRQFLQIGLATGAVAGFNLLPRLGPFSPNLALAAYQSPSTIRKFSQSLRGVGIGGIPVAAPDVVSQGWWQPGVTHYTIDINQFTDTLHPDLDATTLWGYNPALLLGGGIQPQRHLGGIIVAQKGTPVQITFRNNLPATHILPVDRTLVGANLSVNRVSTHLHGGFVPWISDGGPFATWDPNGNLGVSQLGNAVLRPGNSMPLKNAQEFYYPNQQSARMLWYHDHALGITRLNAYAGIATAYILRDSFEGNLRNKGLPDFVEYGGREIPIVIQDKVFVNADTISSLDPTWPGPKTTGSLWYPHTYDASDQDPNLQPPADLPEPSCVPEMFGDTMLANGLAYPQATIEARRYRLRVLNACQARFLNLQLYVDDGTVDGITVDRRGVPTNAKGPDFLVIGTEGGFLPKPAVVSANVPFNSKTHSGSLITAPAERWDLIVDFAGFEGKKVILYNDAPAPFPDGDAASDYYPGSPGNPIQPTPGYGPNTRQILRFDVVRATSADLPLRIMPSTDLREGNEPLPVPLGITTPPPGVPIRQLTLNETFDGFGRLIQFLGTNASVGGGFGRAYLDPTTETTRRDSTEVWQIANLTGDTHPIHFHLVNVQILSRQSFNPRNYNGTPILNLQARPPDPSECGWKETVRMNPGEVTTVIMQFKLPQVPFTVPSSPRTGGNEYVWHCHILEHEEHDMMRPLVVV